MNNDVLISTLLKEDDPLISENLKSIIDKEEKYAPFLYAIEESVAHEYLQNNKLKDKEIIDYLKFLLKNINSSIESFNSDFESTVSKIFVATYSASSASSMASYKLIFSPFSFFVNKFLSGRYLFFLITSFAASRIF